tara:strand:- start:1070 stop:1291 length:222 start_codon:yes stop_codon:yes gene_type:complete
MNSKHRTEMTNELIDKLHAMLDVIENGDCIEDYDSELIACREAISTVRDIIHIQLKNIQNNHFWSLTNDGVEI